jgi:hypothetical protein
MPNVLVVPVLLAVLLVLALPAALLVLALPVLLVLLLVLFHPLVLALPVLLVLPMLLVVLVLPMLLVVLVVLVVLVLLLRVRFFYRRLVEARVVLRCFRLCSPLLLRLMWLVVLAPLLFAHCLFPGPRIRRHRIVLIVGFF